MSEPGCHNAKETTDGWTRYCACGGEAWPQLQGKWRVGAPIAVECFKCGKIGPEANDSGEAVRAWNEMIGGAE